MRMLHPLLALALLAACERARPEPGTEPPPVAASAAPAAVRVILNVPDSVGWNGEDSLRVTVDNATPAPLPAGELRLALLPPATFPPDSGASEVRVPVPALAAGASVVLARAFRMPPSPLPGAATPTAYPVEAQLGTAAPVGDTLHVRASSAVVVGGCATSRGAVAQRFGVGPVRVGMSAAALRASCPDARDTAWSAEGTRERGMVANVGGVPVLAELGGDRVGRITVADPRLRTAAGLGVGSTLEELRSRYGRACAASGEGRIVVWFTSAPGLAFRLDAADVGAWTERAGTADDLPAAARVAGFAILGADVPCPTPEATETR